MLSAIWIKQKDIAILTAGILSEVVFILSNATYIYTEIVSFYEFSVK